MKKRFNTDIYLFPFFSCDGNRVYFARVPAQYVYNEIGTTYFSMPYIMQEKMENFLGPDYSYDIQYLYSHHGRSYYRTNVFDGTGYPYSYVFFRPGYILD